MSAVKYYKNGDLEELLAEYRDVLVELQPALDRLDQLKEKVKERALEELSEGDKLEIDGAKITIREGYTRTFWDGKALEGYAAVRPEVNQFRSEREYSPSAVIKVEK